MLYDTPKVLGLVINIPLDNVAVGNLTNLLEAKGNLIKKALSVENLPLSIGEDIISFPWFSTMPEPDEVTAYPQFIAALCKISKKQKRILAIVRHVENEKYAFLCFLLRLGFIGEEYKLQERFCSETFLATKHGNSYTHKYKRNYAFVLIYVKINLCQSFEYYRPLLYL